MDKPIIRPSSKTDFSFIEAALRFVLQEGAQFLLVGAASDPHTLAHFTALQKEYAGRSQVHMELLYDERLAHLIYAASDLVIVPSLFEPCGLTQMIAMRYGAVPLVRRTGGLADTVVEEEDGFLFGPPTPEGVRQALGAALTCWKRDPEQWNRLRLNGMTKDLSWKKACQNYLNLYRAAPSCARSI